MLDVTTCGVAADGGAGDANTEAVNRILADGSGPLHLAFPPGTYTFSGPIASRNRSLRIEGAGVEGTILTWVTGGGIRFAGDLTHRFKCTDLTLTTTVPGNPAAAISVTSTDVAANTIGNQHKIADVAIRGSAFHAGGAFRTGILIDGGAHGIGNVSLTDVVVQGVNTAGIATGTIGVHACGRTYGIRLITSQFTWVDYAFKGQDQVESAQWIGSSAGATRYGFYVDALTWPAGLTNSMTVERGDFACVRRPIYLDHCYQCKIQGNTIHDFPLATDSWVGVDFACAASQNRILDNFIYPVSAVGVANRYGVSYVGSHSTISRNPTIKCTVGIYLSPTATRNTVSDHRDIASTVPIMDQGTGNLKTNNTSAA